MGLRRAIREYLTTRGLPVPGFAQDRPLRAYERLLRSLGPGDTAIDCGANVGAISAILGANGARVHAFEPNPDIFPRLTEAVAHLPNVICHNKAVSAADGTIRLFLHERYAEDRDLYSLSSSVLADKPGMDSDAAIEVERVDLDRFIRSLDGPVKLLKIDIEGAEYELLEHLLDRNTFELVATTLVETHANKLAGFAERDAELRRRIKAAGLRRRIDLDWH